jgi:hypothetical protein
MSKRLPDIVYIGYQKTGSAFLRSYLEFHPQISWTRCASTFKFSQSETRASEYSASLPDSVATPVYVDTFEGLATGVVFKQRELTAEERFTPHVYPSWDLVEIDIEQTARFVHSVLPKAKIIISVRSQANWLISNWNHFVNRLPDHKRSFQDFLFSFEGKSLLHSGQFDRTISAFQDLYGRKNVLTLPLEAVSADLEGSLRRLCTFMGVDYLDFSAQAGNRNKGRDDADLLVRRHAGGRLTASATARKLYPLAKPAIQLLARRLNKNAISKEERQLLEAFYSPSNKATSELIGMDLHSLGYPV